MTDPNANILEEISNQDLEEISAAGANTVTVFDCAITISLCSKIIGNPGKFCTVTVECQSNC